MNTLIERASINIDKILELLNIDFVYENNSYFGCCPIHGGDNPTACRIYLNNNSPKWCCFTHSCDEKYCNDLLGFISGVLKINREDAKKWLSNLDNNQKLDRVVAKQPKIEKYTEEFPKYTRAEVRRLLEIPSKYYINRNYSKEILDKYDIGFSRGYKKLMYNRVVAPIYDPDYKYTIGCTGRSLYDKCEKCKGFHNPNYSCLKIPPPKWRHDNRFKKSKYLYNWWFCRPYIKKTKRAFIVEGPGDVWRAAESDINNVVAIMGAKITDSQAILLESAGATDIILVRDNDEAGLKCLESVQKKMGNACRIHSVVPNKKDIGDCTIQETKELLKDFI